eukprot:3465116-Pleurochrysis_carterae.AAC.1
MVSRLLANVVAHPHDDKYKRVRLSNAKIYAAIGQQPVALRLLRLCGFAPVGDGETLQISIAEAGGIGEVEAALEVVREAEAGPNNAAEGGVSQAAAPQTAANATAATVAAGTAAAAGTATATAVAAPTVAAAAGDVATRQQPQLQTHSRTPLLQARLSANLHAWHLTIDVSHCLSCVCPCMTSDIHA